MDKKDTREKIALPFFGIPRLRLGTGTITIVRHLRIIFYKMMVTHAFASA